MRSILIREYDRRKKRNPSYSMRAFSRSLGISPSFFSKINTGKASLSDSMFSEMLKKFNVSPFDLIKIPRKLLQHLSMQPVDTLMFDATVVFAAISDEGLKLCELKKLSIPSDRVQAAVRNLTERGIIELVKDRLILVHLNLENSLASLEHRRGYHRQVYEQWQAAMENDEASVHSSNLIVRCSRESEKLVAEELIEFQKRLNTILEKDRGDQRVININTNMFPVSEGFAT